MGASSARQEARLPTYTEQDDGASVTLSVGGQFEVRLAENPSTGYRWQLADVDHAILEIVQDEPRPADPSRPGAGGQHAWTLLARAPGACALRFAYRRSWEGVAPAQAFALDVTVT